MAESKTVLVVEDNDKNMRLFRDLLLVKGYKVLDSANGKGGLELAKRHLPDLIIMDWFMPVMNGKEAISLLKASASTKEIPVLVVTASAMSNQIQEVQHSGCNDYLHKPIDIAEFFQKVETLLF